MSSSAKFITEVDHRVPATPNSPEAPADIPDSVPAAGAKPRRQRRKEARPGEIIAAAMALFAEKGFAATRLDDVARQAGVAKGTLYVYFSTKEDLFRAVAKQAFVSDFAAINDVLQDVDGSLSEVLSRLHGLFAHLQGESAVPAILRMIIAESRNFPDLAAIWQDEVALPLIDRLAAIIERAQERGEVREGDARLYAFSITGPLSIALLYNDCFGGLGSFTPDLHALTEQHFEVLQNGLFENGGAKLVHGSGGIVLLRAA